MHAPQALAPFAITIVYVEILANVTAREAWEARLSTEYGHAVVLMDAYGTAPRSSSSPPFWGVSYTAAGGSNGSLVRRAATEFCTS